MNNKPTGWFVILGDTGGKAEVGTLLTARPNAVEDADGMGFITYQWMRNGNAIAAAKAQKYRVTEADAGSEITVVMFYRDGAGNQEAVTSKESVSIPDPVIEALHAIYFLIFSRRGDDAGMTFYANLIRNHGWEPDAICADMQKNRDKGAK